MGEKKVKGRKRQIAVDTQGNMHEVFVHKANIRGLGAHETSFFVFSTAVRYIQYSHLSLRAGG